MSDSKRSHDIALFNPSANMTAAKCVTASIAVGGKQLVRGGAGTAAREILTRTAGPEFARLVMRGGGKAAAGLAPLCAVVELALDQKATSDARSRGEITDAQARIETGGNVGNAVGGLGGAAGGAALGTLLFPGIGTLVGGLVGGLLAGRLGREIGRGVAE